MELVYRSPMTIRKAARPIIAAAMFQIAAIPPLAAAEPVMPDAATSLTPPQRTILRCAAAFALENHRQRADGKLPAPDSNAMAARRKEYFVRAGAQLIEKAGLTRPQLSSLLQDEIRALSRGDALALALPGCMASLAASDL